MINTKTITVTYIIALSIIASLLLSSQLVIQYFLDNQINDSHVVSLAGRQRSLCHRLTKYAFLIQNQPYNDDYWNTFEDAYQEFTIAHDNLTGKSHTLHLKYQNPPEISQLYQKLAPHYQAIQQSCIQILACKEEKMNNDNEMVSQLLDADQAFFPLMDKIVDAYVKQSQAKIRQLSNIEIGLFILALCVLVIEVLLIFRPMSIGITKATKQLRIQNEELNTINEELQTSGEELRQNLEEMHAIQESLKDKSEELEEALTNNLSITRALDNSAIVTITDLKGNILKVNDIFCEISGYTREELLGQNQNIVNSGYHPKSLWKEMWRIIGKGGTWRGEVKNRAKDGSIYWVDAVINPIRNREGKIHRYLAIRYLITDKKEKEKEIEQLSLVASKTDNGVIITNKNIEVLWVNKGFEKISGYTFNELLGKNPKFLQGKDTNPEHSQKIREKLAQKTSFKQEILNYSKEGKSYWAQLNITPILDDNGEVTKYIGIQRDITEDKRLMNMVQHQNEELQNSLAQLVILRQKSEGDKAEIQKLLKNVLASINYAKRIQNAIIPTETDIQQVIPDSFVMYEPRDIVSGDFYWVADKGSSKIIVVGDCTGHGVPGAFMTMVANNILNQIVHNYEIHEADEILTIVPTLLKKTFSYTDSKIQDGMDMAVITIVTTENCPKIVYAGAMTPLYYVQEHNGQQEFYEIKADKIPIGGYYQKADYDYNRKEVEVTQPTVFYLASDGYQDQFGGENNRKFLRKKFKNLLRLIAHEPINTQKQILNNTFQDWRSKHQQTDDVVVLGFRIGGE